ncbi:MAG: hypothetical protein J1D77_07465 [Muribaculaceae bacterium]|nr:hypothetical protein [Muribaculaceae bacterium]
MKKQDRKEKFYRIIGIDPNDDYTLEDLADNYLRAIHPPFCREDDGEETTIYRGLRRHLSSLNSTLEYICGEKNPTVLTDTTKYKYNSHQWILRLKKNMGLTNILLSKFSGITGLACKDFEDLRDEVETQKEPGFGNTGIYDFSLRFAYKNSPHLLPEKFVYLHADPYWSAQYLHYIGEITAPWKRGMYNVETTAFRTLSGKLGMEAMDIEHFLCLYHDYIYNLACRKPYYYPLPPRKHK